jgi:rSAM/selenodomain-associated transferase 2
MLSFVIPVLNEAERIPHILERLRRDFPGSERIVVDGGSKDVSVARALAAADMVLLSDPGRARQMNLGAACARGDWLCFLHADTVPEFTAAELSPRLEVAPQWAFCRARLSSSRRSLAVVGWCMNQRSRVTSVATGDQLLMVRRETFAALGGFADVPLMEDVEICKRLRRRAPPQVLPLRVATSPRRWEEQGVVRTVLRMWALRLAYWLGVSPQRLWHHYYGPRALRAADT